MQLIRLLVKWFVKDDTNTGDEKVRARYAVLGSTLGILCNLFLFAIKLAVGLLCGSMAVISDAFNNLSDTGSSLIALIGSKMSTKKPDKEHPFGHGRLEYIAALIIAFLILVVGIELLQSAGQKILHPEPVAWNAWLAAALGVSVLVKLWMFSYHRYLGKATDSKVLLAASKDSLSDCIATLAVILSMIVGKFTALPVDGIMGALVSCLILYTGFGIAKDTISKLLGTPPSKETVDQITEMILETDGILGMHDLILHDYGPGRVMASAHAEVADDADLVKIHQIITETEEKIEQTLHIPIVLHMDPVSTQCGRTTAVKAYVESVVAEVNPDFSMHDFHMIDEQDAISLFFDLVIPYDVSEQEEHRCTEQILQALKQADPRYHISMKIDRE